MDEKKQIKIESFIGNKENNISSTNTIDLYFTLDKPPKTFEIIEKPFPHIISQSTNLLDGWNNFGYDDNGRRECSQERLSVRNYVGCPQKNSEVKKCVRGCSFCYTQNFGGYWNPNKIGGYYQLFWEKGIATVYINQPKGIMKQINGTRRKDGSEWAKATHCVSSLYHSTVTDPFNELEKTYHLTKQTIENTLKWNIPNEFITKMGRNLIKWNGYSEMLDKMAKQEHSFAQFTIYAVEKIRKLFSYGSSTVDNQFNAVKLCSNKGLFTIVRIDPIIPYISDNLKDIEYLITKAKEHCADHIIASVIDIPTKNTNWFEQFAKISQSLGQNKTIADYEKLYSQNTFKSEKHASNEYRENLFSQIRELCDNEGITMSLCMEFKAIGKGNNKQYIGYNDTFMTSKACEGIKIPLYYRDDINAKFEPLDIDLCDGNCLNSAKDKPTCERICKYDPFLKAKANTLSVYKNFPNIDIDKIDIYYNKILKSRLLNKQELESRITEKITELKGLIAKEGALFIIMKELGINYKDS